MDRSELRDFRIGDRINTDKREASLMHKIMIEHAAVICDVVR